MRGNVFWLLIGICGCISLTLAAPTDSSFVIVSTTEASKENGKETTKGTALEYPILYEMGIKSNISNRFAKTLVVSKVRNAQTSAKETTFTVVLPEKAFISEFVMEIGGNSYKAYVKEKEEAKRDYDRAIESGQSAGHVAVSARDSNRFTVSINVEPEAKAVFLLTYEELLERKDNQYELVLNIRPGQVVKRLNVEVLVNESRPLKFVRTPSLRSGNEVSKNEEKLDPSSDIQIINSTSAVVKFTPDEERQKQFARDLGGKESEGLSGQYVVQYDVERDPHGGEVLLADGYFIHFFAPSDLKPLPKHVVFVLDVSGSMSGTKISQLKDAMKSILDEINKGDIISIVEFSYEAKVWDIDLQNTTTVEGLYGKFTDPFPALSELSLPSPVVATEERIKKAKDIIDKLNADGGTDMIEGLETALYLVKRSQESNSNKTDKKHQPIIIFLTDGEPNVGMASTHEITQTVTKINSETNNAPIFSLSFGSGADKEFLRKLSLKNLGFSRHIYEASDASLQLQEFYKQISSPLLSNIHFKYESDVKDVTKSKFPIYFGGSELVVAGRYEFAEDQPLPISVGGWGPGGPISLRPIVEKPVTSLERLWAYLTVKQTLEKRDSVENKTELNKKALDLALKYSFVTDVTSLVVVKPNDTSSAVDTEEASDNKEPGGRYFSHRLAGGFGGYAVPAAAHNFQYPSTPIAMRGVALPSGGVYAYSALQKQTPVLDSIDALGIRIAEEPESSFIAYSTTSQPIPVSTEVSATVPTLESELTWLTSALNSNGSLTIGPDTYELGENYSTPASDVECPKTPLNSTEAGVCTLLKDCPEVHNALTDFQVYQQYFCPLENRYAGVCCPKKKSN